MSFSSSQYFTIVWLGLLWYFLHLTDMRHYFTSPSCILQFLSRKLLCSVECQRNDEVLPQLETNWLITPCISLPTNKRPFVVKKITITSVRDDQPNSDEVKCSSGEMRLIGMAVFRVQFEQLTDSDYDRIHHLGLATRHCDWFGLIQKSGDGCCFCYHQGPNERICSMMFATSNDRVTNIQAALPASNIFG